MQGALDWIHGFANGGQLQSFVVAAVLVVVTGVVSYFVTKLIRKVLSSDGVPLPSSSILVNIVRAIVWVVGLSIMLSTCFNVDVNGLITALGVGGIALSLGLQDTMKNFIGGLQVTLMKIVRPGDHIVVGTTDGIVQDVSWRQTVVKDYENTIHLIPNAIMGSAEVQKVEPCFLVSTQISFTTDMLDVDDVVREMEIKAKAAVEEVAELEKDPWILLTQIGEYGTWGKLRFVLKSVDQAREARDAALRAIAPYTRVDLEKIPNGQGAQRDEG